ncbi:hypothetical protein HIM_00068 [Hirsutella minnesotensis 3608]|nr:hypothetical protein HIM_00068 [Hirsutella minnesotensis 3608]
MARSEDRVCKAIDKIKTDFPSSRGRLRLIQLDLADLDSVRNSAQDFLNREAQLHMLLNNAGVGYPEPGSITKQGRELRLVVNCLGLFLLTKLLKPGLVKAAQDAPTRTVPVIWVSSSAAEAFNPKDLQDSLPRIKSMDQLDQYSISKLGNYLHATEYAARNKDNGIISVPLNPDALDSKFWRSQGAVTMFLLRKTVLHPPIYGAYSSLFAAFSPKVTSEKSGCFGT